MRRVVKVQFGNRSITMSFVSKWYIINKAVVIYLFCYCREIAWELALLL